MAGKRLLPLSPHAFHSVSLHWFGPACLIETYTQNMDDPSNPHGLVYDKVNYNNRVLFVGYSDQSPGKVVWQDFFRYKIREKC